MERGRLSAKVWLTYLSQAQSSNYHCSINVTTALSDTKNIFWPISKPNDLFSDISNGTTAVSWRVSGVTPRLKSDTRRRNSFSDHPFASAFGEQAVGVGGRERGGNAMMAPAQFVATSRQLELAS